MNGVPFYGVLIDGHDFATLIQGKFSLEIERKIVDFNDNMTNIDLSIIGGNDTNEIDTAYYNQYTKTLGNLIEWFNKLSEEENLGLILIEDPTKECDLFIGVELDIEDENKIETKEIENAIFQFRYGIYSWLAKENEANLYFF